MRSKKVNHLLQRLGDWLAEKPTILVVVILFLPIPLWYLGFLSIRSFRSIDVLFLFWILSYVLTAVCFAAIFERGYGRILVRRDM